MKRAASLIALLATSCTSLEPAYVRPDPAVPASWPTGHPYLQAVEASLPAVRYTDIFTDPRLQTLIGQALLNNRDLMVAAANIAEAREQYRIQRAQQFPQLDASAGATATGTRSNGGSGGNGNGNGNGGASGNSGSGSGVAANYNLGVSVPSFELDLFGRLRSLTHSQLEQFFATEEAARATRLTLVAEIATAWLTHASDESLLKIAQQTAASAQRSVQLTRLRLNGGIAPRTDLSQAEQILDQAQADLARQRTLVAQDVNALQLLVGAPIAPGLLAGSIDEAFGTVVPLPAGVSSYVLLRRPDVLQSEYQLRAANAEIGAARAALFPKISLTGLLGLASSALTSLISGGAFGWSAGANAGYTIFQGGAGRANVRLTEAQRAAAIATYQRSIQTAFREVADALARRGTLNEELASRQRQQAAAGDAYLLTEARYRAGVDPFLNVLDSQRSYYAAQQTLVQMKLTAAENLVTLYQALGGDSLLDPSPVKPQDRLFG
ncbi:efflux transporter outer membrane subunit [Sphingomonas sp.]|uniref:efflux transporter outer membrane subunit n=1 Tax=Sphingomonas sp. TaxID=28214 RepID=UPI0025EB1652|nr:efflux transporter outer membrane subunit [Sphingomonas sp.]MBV9527417.1 efflux transporter outer membrane subunit [Sphingomonas sp.]